MKDYKRWYGIFRAVVVAVDDPMQLDRVRVRVPEVLGNTITDWVWPKAAAPNWSWKPIIGERIWIEFENGDIDRPLYSGSWYPLEQPNNESSVPDEVLAAYARTRCIKTPGGHKIQFKDEDPDDSGAVRGITVESIAGHKIDLIDTSGSEKLSLVTPGGHTIDMDDGSTELNIKHSDGSTKIELTSSGNVKITAKAGSKVELSGAAVLPLAGIVTKNHVCAFTGSPHPQGSLDVEASG